ncbi:hypothetical protein J7T55_004873 [Diaporthe amygdali]|uniref:uncharacterized protein n=1 Tax=Phomopsis amygdali TaxID=1214568 RepID=UPI0022FE93EF|nr:uncharacterized protein J7T55_004873 [Diaporthe amygdali]KAJ0114629.1 hypothetical protein J7T55_004873 [Diaporthe amygdali]
MSILNSVLQATSISISLLAAGGIATLSLFDVPILRAQPASRSLPSIRWLFSRGSHIFPTAAFVSATGFGILAYRSLPGSLASRTVLQLLRDARVRGYLAAATLNIAIAPWTSVMIPNNFELIQMNNNLGGHRSLASSQAAQEEKGNPKQRSARDSVEGKGEVVAEFQDVSDPQEKTTRESSDSEDEQVRVMLTKFGFQNSVRALLMLSGGVIGLVTALG